MTNQRLSISEQALQIVINYLAEKPFKEVTQILRIIQDDVQKLVPENNTHTEERAIAADAGGIPESASEGSADSAISTIAP